MPCSQSTIDLDRVVILAIVMRVAQPPTHGPVALNRPFLALSWPSPLAQCLSSPVTQLSATFVSKSFKLKSIKANGHLCGGSPGYWLSLKVPFIQMQSPMKIRKLRLPNKSIYIAAKELPQRFNWFLFLSLETDLLLFVHLIKFQKPFVWIPWNLSFRYIHCTGQFTPKLKANAEPRLLSSLVWID